MRIYFDTCCFNRPFDDAGDDRIAIEAEAILRVLARIESGEWKLVVSDAVLYELRRISDSRRREACLSMAALATHHESASDPTTAEAERLLGFGFGEFDAAHLAFALAARAEIFLTVDDRLLRKARVSDTLAPLVVANPTVWLATLSEGEEP